MMRAIGRGAKRAHGLFALTIATVLALDPFFAVAQDKPLPARDPAATPAPSPAAAPAQPPAATPAPAEAEQPAANSSFSREELEKLLAPIALYPDPLLAQLLPASAYRCRSSRPSAGWIRTRLSSPKTTIPDRRAGLGSGGEGARALS